MCGKKFPTWPEEDRTYCDDCTPTGTKTIKQVQREVMEVLRRNNVRMIIEACGCCDGPWVTIQEMDDNGFVMVEFPDIPFCNINMIEGEVINE